MIDQKTKKILQLQSEICNALSNVTRLEIIYLLKQREKAVSELALELGVSMSNLSQHLKTLKEKGLVKFRKQGQHIYYSLAHASVNTICNSMREIVKENLQAFSVLSKLTSS